MNRKLARTAVTAFGGIAALCLGSAPAALASPPRGPHLVPCRAPALSEALSTASDGETLILAPGCTYELRDALPAVTTRLTIVGLGSTLRRSDAPGTPSFSILTVADTAGADLTVVGVGFGNGGGPSDDYGGAIDNGGTVTVRGGTFQDNSTGEYGGAIYNDGTLRVSEATFAGNVSVYGGAIDNAARAAVFGSGFLGNRALALFGAPDNAYGGAIYSDDTLDLTDDGFLANSSAGDGGAIYNAGTVRARHVTITANSAADEGGGVYDQDAGRVTLRDSAVFGNRPGNCYPSGTIAGCSG
jgi:predicted outer membrane repeat protein